MVGKYPQGSYAVVAHEIQSEWIFLQRVTKGMGQGFAGMGKVPPEIFCLVFSLEDKNPPFLCCRIYKNFFGKEIRAGPTKTCDIISRERYKLATR